MKKQVKNYFWLLVMGLILAAPSAQAHVRFSVFGVGNDANINDKSGAYASPAAKLAFGGGAQVEFGLGRVVGLEIGAIYLPRTFTQSAGGISVDAQFNYLQIPLQFRFWLGRFITLGVGGYYASGLGNITFGGVSASYSAVGISKSDYGLLGSVGFNFPLSQTVALLVEGRYAYGLADLNSPANPAGKVTWKDMQGLVGLRFGMGASK